MHRARSLSLCWLLVASGCAQTGPSSMLTLRRVVLNQSGSGYFERAGRTTEDHLQLRLRAHEVDDVLATLTVLERGGARRSAVAAGVPHESGGGAVQLDLRFADRRARDLTVAYAVPTADWQTTYRVVMPERVGGPALLQAWALVHNASDEDWDRVELTLASGAPLSFAFHLRNPRFNARPDASDSLSAPVARGPVTATTARVAGGEIVRSADSGRARVASDRDGDRVPDADDRCPDQPEIYNGTSDEDGCPDVGSGVVVDAELRIVQRVPFAAGSSELTEANDALMDTIARTLLANGQIELVDVEGHAADDEPSSWVIAADRASAVRARLVTLGVDAMRLRTRSFGATRPADASRTPTARALNRAVSFRVARTTEDRAASRPAAGPVTVTAAAASAGSPASAAQLDGASRFTLAEPVSIRAGSAALVTLASREITGEDVLLFRPEAAVPASEAHPFRAARLRNSLGVALMPGPVALFARGTFAGQGILRRVEQGETALVPYAIDPSTRVTVVSSSRSEPRRIVSASRASLVLEDAHVQATRYDVAAGPECAERIFLRHERLQGYQSRELPPGSERGADADLVAIPLTPGGAHSVQVEQWRATTRSGSLLEDLETDLEPYLRGSSDAVRQQLRAILDQRAALARADSEAEALRSQLTDVSDRNAELRESLRALRTVTDDARIALRAQLTQQLQASLARGAALASGLATSAAAAAAARAQLTESLRTLRVE